MLVGPIRAVLRQRHRVSFMCGLAAVPPVHLPRDSVRRPIASMRHELPAAQSPQMRVAPRRPRRPGTVWYRPGAARGTHVVTDNVSDNLARVLAASHAPRDVPLYLRIPTTPRWGLPRDPRTPCAEMAHSAGKAGEGSTIRPKKIM